MENETMLFNMVRKSGAEGKRYVIIVVDEQNGGLDISESSNEYKIIMKAANEPEEEESASSQVNQLKDLF